MTAIVWLRRASRGEDNTALVEASEEFEDIVPFYVVDENYFRRETLGYPRVKFWRDSLMELEGRFESRGKTLWFVTGNL